MVPRPHSSESPPSSGERRSHRRAALNRPVLLDAPAVPQPVAAVDVSGSGLSIAVDVPLEVGAIVEVYFELPIGYAVEARAEVVRQANGLTALRFIELGRESQLALRSFCRISGLHALELASATR